MKRIILIGLMVMASTSLAESPETYVREDLKELARAQSAFALSTVDSITNVRTRIEILEKKIDTLQMTVMENSRFRDTMLGRGSVTSSIWNIFFVLLISIIASMATLVLAWLVGHIKINNSRDNHNNKH